MTVVVLGSGGRLGGALVRHLRQSGRRVVAFDHRALDLTRPEIIRDRLEPLQFDAVVNAAALTSLEACEEDPVQADAANARGPALVASLCAARGARLVHVSTDYVYDGARPGSRTEDDPVAPLGHYARSKLLGEQLVMENSGGRALIARTSWIFGPDRPAFPDSIIKRARREPRVQAVSDKFSTPTSSAEFAELIEPFLTGELAGASGILNVCNSGAASWQEYAQAALQFAAEAGVPLRATAIEPIPLAEMPGFVAQRPRHTAMSVEKLARLLGRQPPPWQEALRRYITTYYSAAGA